MEDPSAFFAINQPFFTKRQIAKTASIPVIIAVITALFAAKF